VHECCRWNRGDDDAVKANIDIWADLYAVMHERMALVHEDSNMMKMFCDVTTVIERKAQRVGRVYTVRLFCTVYIIFCIIFNKQLNYYLILCVSMCLQTQCL
jgi:hypothetical protein